MSSRSSRRWVGVVVLGALAVACAVGACRPKETGSRPDPKAAPISSTDHEGLVAFVKYASCEPAACDAVKCDPFSQGLTRNLPAYVARCHWTDNRDRANPVKCAFVHYAADRTKGTFTELFLSARAPGGGCQPDKAFNEKIASLGYSGALP